MKLDEFINKYIKTKVDFDGAFGAQCVDLFRQYCKDVLNIPHTGSVNGAKDLYLNYRSLPTEMMYFDQYKFISDGYGIKYGDVIIWNKNDSNEYGHVAIAINKIDADKVLVFEQIGFSKNGKDKALMSVRSLENCLGILRARNGGNI